MDSISYKPEYLVLYSKNSLNANNSKLSYTWNMPQLGKDRMQSCYVSLVSFAGEQIESTDANFDFFTIALEANTFNVTSSMNNGTPLGFIQREAAGVPHKLTGTSIFAQVPTKASTITLSIIQATTPIDKPDDNNPWEGVFTLKFEFVPDKEAAQNYEATMKTMI